MKDIHTKS